MKNRQLNILAFSILSASVMASFGATAQAADDSSSFSNTLEEVMVTARKREESLQDVPFSVSATTEKQLQDRGIMSIEDVARTVAGFSVQNLGPGQSQIAIRGASAGQIVRDQPGVKEEVGVYLDESSISLSLFTPDIDMYDMNRIEVLRGPQGTLYGSGSLSGTVKYITNQPDPEKVSSGFEVSANNIQSGASGGGAKAFFNTPIGDSSALRVTAYYDRTGGWVDAQQPDQTLRKDINTSDRTGVRAAFLFAPNENLSITPRFIYQKVSADGWNRQDAFNILANPYTTTTNKFTLFKNQQFSQFKDPFDDKFKMADLTISYDFGKNLTLTSVTSYTDREIRAVRDATALTGSITGGTIGFGPEIYNLDAPLFDDTYVSGWTQELRIAGGNDQLTWVLGGFYSRFNRNYGQSLVVGGFEDLTGIPTAGAFIAPKDGLFVSKLMYDFDQVAFFGEATYTVSDKLNLTAGIRYYDFNEDRVQTFDGIFAAPGTTRGTTDATGWAPRLIADWTLSDTLSVNAQISKGFRLGGINDPLNIPLCTPADLQTFGGNDSWDDEVLWNYEAGIKSIVMDGRGTFNIAIFYQDIQDLQATVTAGSCSSRVVFNVPDAHSAGVEVEFSAQQTERFDWALTASYIEAELDSTVNSTAADGSVTVVGGIKSGNRLATVPKYQATAAANYVWPVASGWEAYVNGIVSYTGTRYTQLGDEAAGFGTVDLNSFGANTPGAPLTQGTFVFNPRMPDYTIANTRIGVRNDKYDISLYVNNVTDEHALLALDQERGTRARVGYLVNQPRTYGIVARVHF